MAVQGIDLGKYKLGWHDTESYVFTPKKGLNEEIVREISWRKSEPEWMTKFRLNALKRFERKPMLEWFAKNMPDIDFDDIYYYFKPTDGSGQRLGHAPGRDEDHVREARHPRSRAQVPRRRDRAVRIAKSCTTRTARTSRRSGIIFTDMDTALREYPELVQKYFGTVIPPGDNKFAGAELGGVVGWLVHLRAAGRARRHAAAGVLPHQRGERRPVRAHADHRRRRLVGALRRGLLGAGVLDRLAALRGGRADRQAGRAHPLHDDPELVAERLQPRDQARRAPRPSRPSSGSTATSVRSSR